MDEPAFWELCAFNEAAEPITFENGSSVSALVSAIDDKTALIVGGVTGVRNLTLRVLDSDLASVGIHPGNIVRKTVVYNGDEYRVAQTRKHPRSAVRLIVVHEK